MKNLSPIKKIILALLAMCIVVSIITANNLSSVMMLIAARNNARNNAQYAQQQSTAQQGGAVQQSGAVQSGSTVSGDSGSSSGSNDAQSSQTDNKQNNAGSSNSGSTDVKSIVEEYKKAVNNAKSKAKTITLVKDGAKNYNGIFEAGMLSSIGQGLVDKFMGISDKNEVIDKSKLPPQGKQCTLSVSDVVSATKKTEGDYQIITLKLKNEENPKSGSGIGAAVNVIEESQITEPVEGIVEVKNIKLAYENVSIVAKIDKSGKLVYLTTDAPSVLSLDAKAGIEIKGAKVGIEVISEYKIEY